MYALYCVKTLAFVAAWMGFCAFNAGDGPSLMSWEWAVHPDAFKKAILWSMVFEGLGLGCGSGPLTGRYMPPVAACLHFARPGTVKIPLIPGLPILGGSRRTILDAALYVAHIGWLLWILCAPAVTPSLVAPSIALLAALALADKTVLLACRGEHYGAMLVCFLFVEDWIPGAKIVALAIWIWAAVSKLNAHFPSVIGVMTCNSPWARSERLRRAMVRSHPDDLRPSRLAHVIARGGTLLELVFPVFLVLGEGGSLTIAGLVLMVLFHVYITSNVPMAVPLEWNVVVVYGAFVLFGHHAAVPVSSLQSPGLIVFLVAAIGLVPLVGNFFPSRVSFLLSMRYYAGNWPFSVWLFRGEGAEKLDECVEKAAELPHKQLAHYFDERTSAGALSKVPAFRAMHLHGRALHDLIPLAVDDESKYTTYDGEIIAGMVLGYNFGDGHLHGRRLLEAIQERCSFAPGELRHVYIESQPLGGSALRWQIRDAAEGLLHEGETSIETLKGRQPWPELKGS
jgi:hypothetical protein